MVCTRPEASLPAASRVPSRVGPTQQGGAYAAGRSIGIHQRVALSVVQHFGLRLQVIQTLQHGIALLAVDQSTHAHGFVARVAHAGFGQARADGLCGCGVHGFGHEDTANGGAFLAGLHRHLARHFLDQQVKRFATGGLAGQE